MKFRDATATDSRAISEFVSLHAERHIEPSLGEGGINRLLASMNEAATRERIESGWLHICCFDEDVLAGIVVVKPPKHLYHLFVRSERQGRGIGRALFHTADNRTDDATSTRIETVNASMNAIGAYTRLGFTVDGAIMDVDGVRFQPMVRSS